MIHHIKNRKVKNHVIISIDAEKASDKSKSPFMVKITILKIGIEGAHLNKQEATYD